MPALEMSVPAGAAARASWLVALASTALLGAAPCADSVSRGVLSDCSPAACSAAPLRHLCLPEVVSSSTSYRKIIWFSVQ